MNETPLPFTLQNIYLRASRISMAEDFDPMVPGIPLNGLFRVTSQRVLRNEITLDNQEKVHGCVFITGFEFRYLKESATTSERTEQESAWADISADFAAAYLLNVPDLPESEIAKWGATNVLLHSWPYWREFCQSSLLRMALPSTVMPMLNVGDSRATVKD